MLRLTLTAVALCATAALAQDIAPAPNGITIPEGYKDWRVISVSERTDNETLRAIVGNDVAIEAMRAGETNPWPDGAILGKIVYAQGEDENWPTAIVPKEFRAAEFMIKDATQYADTAGWGWARWLGMDQTPFGENAEFAADCVACHEPVAANDYVFTHPVLMP